MQYRPASAARNNRRNRNKNNCHYTNEANNFRFAATAIRSYSLIYACFYDWLNVVTHYEKEASHAAQQRTGKSLLSVSIESLWVLERLQGRWRVVHSRRCCAVFSLFVYWWRRVVGWARERCNLPCNGTNCGVFAEQLSDHCRLQGRNLGAAFEDLFLIDSWILNNFSYTCIMKRQDKCQVEKKSKWLKLFGPFQYKTKTSIKWWKFSPKLSRRIWSLKITSSSHTIALHKGFTELPKEIYCIC